MKIQRATDRAAWDHALAAHAPPTFLQSWAWGETQAALGEQVLRFEAVENGQTVGIVQAVTVTARRGRFLHVPHGPVLGSRESGVGSRQTLSALLSALREEATRQGLAFLRVSPIQEDTEEHRKLYRAAGFRPAPIHVHAERLWILDLELAEEQLLAHMRKTTRNLIRRAERDGVRVRLSTSLDDIPIFQALYAETARRERFAPFSERELAAEFRAFAAHPVRDQVSNGAQGSAAFFIAEHQGTPLSAAMVLFTPWSAFYHHGASSRDRPQIPAAYALQWAAIREAKRRGCREYNFWGITPGARRQAAGGRNHPWAGLTLFKTGFGGEKVPLVPTQDLPLSARYWPVFILETARRWKRGM